MTIKHKTGRFYDFEQVLEIEAHPDGFIMSDKSRGMPPLLIRVDKELAARLSDGSIGRIVEAKYDTGKYEVFDGPTNR